MCGHICINVASANNSAVCLQFNNTVETWLSEPWLSELSIIQTELEGQFTLIRKLFSTEEAHVE